MSIYSQVHAHVIHPDTKTNTQSRPGVPEGLRRPESVSDPSKVMTIAVSLHRSKPHANDIVDLYLLAWRCPYYLVP